MGFLNNEESENGLSCMGFSPKSERNKEKPNGIMDFFFFLIIKKVRIVSLAWETPTGPLFIPTKYESNPLKIKVTYNFEKD